MASRSDHPLFDSLRIEQHLRAVTALMDYIALVCVFSVFVCMCTFVHTHTHTGFQPFPGPLHREYTCMYSTHTEQYQCELSYVSYCYDISKTYCHIYLTVL